jgi:hypothetical protein
MCIHICINTHLIYECVYIQWFVPMTNGFMYVYIHSCTYSYIYTHSHIHVHVYM